MSFSPNGQPSQQEIIPDVPEVLSKQEAGELFSSLSCVEFRSDVREMVRASNLSPERQSEIVIKLEELYSLLEQGFPLKDLKFLFMKGVDIDINNEDEKDLYNYFIFGIKEIYRNFRMMYPQQAVSPESKEN